MYYVLCSNRNRGQKASTRFQSYQSPILIWSRFSRRKHCTRLPTMKKSSGSVGNTLKNANRRPYAEERQPSSANQKRKKAPQKCSTLVIMLTPWRNIEAPESRPTNSTVKHANEHPSRMLNTYLASSVSASTRSSPRHNDP